MTTTEVAAIDDAPAVAERTYGPITRTDIVRYAGAGGDFNPIHHDETFAVAAGYPTVFAHGLLTAGILSSFAVEWLGREHLRSYAVRYRDQVWPGDVLTTRGEVTSVREVTGGREVTATLSVRACGADDVEPRLVLAGSATAFYPGTEPSGEVLHD